MDLQKLFTDLSAAIADANAKHDAADEAKASADAAIAKATADANAAEDAYQQALARARDLQSQFQAATQGLLEPSQNSSRVRVS